MGSQILNILADQVMNAWGNKFGAFIRSYSIVSHPLTHTHHFLCLHKVKGNLCLTDMLLKDAGISEDSESLLRSADGNTQPAWIGSKTNALVPVAPAKQVIDSGQCR